MKQLYPFVLFLSISLQIQSQNITINNDGAEGDVSAILDLQSVSKGMLAPRLTSAQRNDISAAATGLIVFDTDEGLYYQFNGIEWVEFEITNR